jgi:hypothetical protein
VTDPHLRAAPAVEAEIVCAQCPSPAAIDASAPGPSLVIRLPLGEGQPTLELSNGGRALLVASRADGLVWEHEIDLPFAIALGDVTVHRRRGCVELRMAVPAAAPVPA